MKGRSVRRVLTAGSAAAAHLLIARPRLLGWGATDQERESLLAGDDLIANANLTATRAITIHASADQVWPWIAQLGQGRAGFYSYDFLENLAGCDIHSADRIVPEWQNIAVGDDVMLAPNAGLTVASQERGRSLVFRGGAPLGKLESPYDFTWAFVLQAEPDGSTRLLVRERYAYRRIWAPILVEPTGVISTFMSRKMLRGIRDRAERTAAPPREGFSAEEARTIGERIGIHWDSSRFDASQFRMGLDVELEHGIRDAVTNVTDDDAVTTGKIARAHLNEFPDYYTRLGQMEEQAKHDLSVA